MKTNVSFHKQKVYEILRALPHGRVITYGKIAEMMGNKHFARSVGNVLHSNPDGDKNPCFKVVSSDGKLSRAYAFGGIDTKKRRLEAEGIEVVNYQVNLKKYGV